MGRMIEGTVNAAYEAVIRLLMIGSLGQRREIDAVIDTGFTGFLTMPPALTWELELAFAGFRPMILADGSLVSLETYHAAVIWDGSARYVRANLTDTTPTVGMSLLDGYDLSVQVRQGGRVLIQAGD